MKIVKLAVVGGIIAGTLDRSELAETAPGSDDGPPLFPDYVKGER